MTGAAAAAPASSRQRLFLWGAVALFLSLRLFGWLNSPEIENHDSLTYMNWAETFASGDRDAIVSLDPDAAPLYPASTAFAKWFVGDVETAARLVSLLASIVAMVAAYRLATRIGGPVSGAIAVVLLAVSPHDFRMSYSVLTEPLYNSLFLCTAAAFIAGLDRPGIGRGVLVGALAGLAFLTRFEGVLLLLAVPLLHAIHAAVFRRQQPLRPLIHANLAFVLVFTMLAAPQVARVSLEMNTFALNGRSIWSIVLSNPDGKSYDEKLSGLDYDPHTTNVQYLKAHPNQVDAMIADSGTMKMLRQYLQILIRNLRQLHDSELAPLVGIPVLVFACIGVFAAAASGRAADGLLVLAFLALALVAPLLYVVHVRHLLIIVPFLCVLAAPGIVRSADAISQSLSLRGRGPTGVLVACILVAVAVPVMKCLEYMVRGNFNKEYSQAELRQPVSIIRSFESEQGKPAVVMARKMYICWLAGATPEIPPYTDLDGLLTYLEAHPTDFFFYEQEFLDEYPFARQVGSEAWNRHFEEIYSASDPRGPRVLYALR